MKNVAFNTKKRWDGSLEGTSLGEQGSAGSHLRDDDDNVDEGSATVVVSRLLTKQDRNHHLPEALRSNQLQPLTAFAIESSRKWINNADGFLSAWAAVVYVDMEERFWDEWGILMKEFRDQLGKYLCKSSEWIFSLIISVSRLDQLPSRYIPAYQVRIRLFFH